MAAKRPRSPDSAPPPESSRAWSQAAGSLRLKLLVFWSGAVLMGLEIAGSRILAPHFGNSVFVWGSLITVFLAALSVGNYTGGWLADQRPAPGWLSGISMVVAFWIGGLSYFASDCCQSLVAQGLGEEAGPLVASLILFLPPSIGMGTVSPFAVRLATHSVQSVGKVSGSLYALSTIGSIAGTIVTTFVLIPHVGLAAILRGLGVSLFVVALLGLPSWWGVQGTTGTVFLALLVMVPLRPREYDFGLQAGQRVVTDFGTPYHNVTVIDDFERRVRQLRFDRYVESAISLDPPHASLAAYTHYFHLALLVEPQIERALFIGAGGGVGPRTFRAHAPDMRIDVVDIDPAVLRVARQLFLLDDSPDLRLVAADGRMFVRRTVDPYDCLVLDAFTIGGRIPFHLATADFFRLCHDRLTERGVLVMNVNSAVEGPSAGIFQAIYRSLSAEFPHVYVFAHDSSGRRRTQSTNIMLVATRRSERLSATAWRAKAAAYRSASYVGTRLVEQLVEDLIEDLPDMSTAPLLTDDYAPLETMAF